MDHPSFEQRFRVDLDYYEGRADGIASVNGVSVAEARRDLAARHGFSSWQELRRHVEAMQSGEVPPTPLVLAYRAIEDNDRDRLADLLDRFPDLVVQRGTNGNDLLGMAGDLEIVSLLLAEPWRGSHGDPPRRAGGAARGGRRAARAGSRSAHPRPPPRRQRARMGSRRRSRRAG